MSAARVVEVGIAAVCVGTSPAAWPSSKQANRSRPNRKTVMETKNERIGLTFHSREWVFLIYRENREHKQGGTVKEQEYR